MLRASQREFKLWSGGDASPKPRARQKTKRKGPTPEGKVLKDCMEWLETHGIFCWRNNTGSYKPEGSRRFIRFGYPGSADILGLTKSGRFLAVECKANTDLTDDQACFGQRIRGSGGLYIVAYSVDALERSKGEILGI